MAEATDHTIRSADPHHAWEILRRHRAGGAGTQRPEGHEVVRVALLSLGRDLLMSEFVAESHEGPI